MNYLLFNVVLELDLNYICIKFKHEKGALKEVIHGWMREYLMASLECMQRVSENYKKAKYFIIVTGRMGIAID